MCVFYQVCHYISKNMVCNTVMLSEVMSSEATEGCVTVKYSLAGRPSQNQLRFSLKPAEDTVFDQSADMWCHLLGSEVYSSLLSAD